MPVKNQYGGIGRNPVKNHCVVKMRQVVSISERSDMRTVFSFIKCLSKFNISRTDSDKDLKNLWFLKKIVFQIYPKFLTSLYQLKKIEKI